MSLEAYAATLPRQARTANEDAFWIRSRSAEGSPPFLAIADGAGAAEGVARRVLRGFERWTVETPAEEIATFAPWSRFVQTTDLGMAGGGREATFAALAFLEDRIVGVVVGDSRIVLWRRDGDLDLVSEGAPKWRLGSGVAQPWPIHLPFERGDVAMLLTDGSWTPLARGRLRSTVARSVVEAFPELPERLLREASRGGRGDP